MITTAPATEDDVPALVVLLEEMDAFYGDASEGTVDERTAQLHAALFGESPRAAALLAKDDGGLIGMASYSFLWPAAGVSTSLYLKELFVRREQRQAGVGRLLMDRLVDIARHAGCTRVEWTTDRSNEDAQRFYESLGNRVNEGKLFYRVEL